MQALDLDIGGQDSLEIKKTEVNESVKIINEKTPNNKPNLTPV